MTIKIDNETYYTVKDLVKILGLSEMTIRTYLKKGIIKGNRPTNKFWYIRKENLKLFLEGKKQKIFGNIFHKLNG